MKLIVVVLLSGFCFLANGTSSSLDPEEVADYITQLAMKRLGGIRFMRAAGGQQCYDKYYPQFTEIADRGKADSQTCKNRAASRKQDELAKVENERKQIEKQVQAVLNSLQTCSSNQDAVDFLQCLKTDASADVNYIKLISEISTTVYNQIESSIATIEVDEDNCIANVIVKAQSDTKQLYADLQRCLINGFEDPKPESSTEGASQSSSTESVPQSSSTEAVSQSSSTEAVSQSSSTEAVSQSSSSTAAVTQPSSSSTPEFNDDANPAMYPEADI